ncbi:flavin reductase family protein [Pseudomonas sp. MWU13-2100]|uniref:flavin reductase family protein n=1 Tax=Pseudomonas sp. MWU13-2100 TaxID=2935075 RepID=UPI00399B4EC7
MQRCLTAPSPSPTVVTTLDDGGAPAGLAVSSFNSMPLESALVLWSLRKESYTARAFLAVDGFAINVLVHEQQLLSDRFRTVG